MKTYRIMHPELQAEIKFGRDNSESLRLEDFGELQNMFLSKSEEWKNAEGDILTRKEDCLRHKDPISEKLYSVVNHEVSYLYAMWEGDFHKALEFTRTIADALSGEETKAYRAWWYYLSAEVAMALYEATADQTYRGTARDFLKRASQCCIGVSWFARLRQSIDAGDKTLENNEKTAIAINAIRQLVMKWGATGPQFDRHISEINVNLHSTEYKEFHRGLKGLGEVLGFNAEMPKGDSTPDCIWSINDMLYVAHEAKSEHTPEDPIGTEDIRQAIGHDKWIRAFRPCGRNPEILCMIESPRLSLTPAANAQAEGLFHVTPVQLTELFGEITTVLRRVRAKWASLSDEKVLEELLRELTENNLTPMQVVKRLSQTPVAEMIKFGGKGDSN